MKIFNYVCFSSTCLHESWLRFCKGLHYLVVLCIKYLFVGQSRSLSCHRSASRGSQNTFVEHVSSGASSPRISIIVIMYYTAMCVKFIQCSSLSTRRQVRLCHSIEHAQYMIIPIALYWTTLKLMADFISAKLQIFVHGFSSARHAYWICIQMFSTCWKIYFHRV